MIKLISTNEKVPVKIDDITIYISPLTFREKANLQDFLSKSVNGDMDSAMQGAALAIKYGVKGIEGVCDSSGKKFKLSFDNDRELSDQSVDDLLNLPQNNKMIMICSSLLEGLPTEDLKNPITGEKIEGVSFGHLMGKPEKKKASGD